MCEIETHMGKNNGSNGVREMKTCVLMATFKTIIVTLAKCIVSF